MDTMKITLAIVSAVLVLVLSVDGRTVQVRATGDDGCPVDNGPGVVHQIIAAESRYFEDIGLEPKLHLPVDHVHLDIDALGTLRVRETGGYSAASKFSLTIPYLLGVAQQKPAFAQVTLPPDRALSVLKTQLDAIRAFQDAHPNYRGFVPWVDIDADGHLQPRGSEVPSLDPGELAWALVAVVGALEDAPDEDRRQVAALAQAVLDRMDFGDFYDAASGRMRGSVTITATGQWSPTDYFLADSAEGVMAVLYAVVSGQAPESAWRNLDFATVDYTTASGASITVLRGWRASFHEQWALGYLPLMASRLAPLYRNYLYAQADYARQNGLPGLLGTAYAPDGQYRQMGVPALAVGASGIDRSDVAVPYASAMGMLIDPAAGACWLAFTVSRPGLATSWGALESVGSEGPTLTMTADGKGLTILSASGGVQSDVERYLQRRLAPGQPISLSARLHELLDAKFEQIMAERHQRPFRLPAQSVPQPRA